MCPLVKTPHWGLKCWSCKVFVPVAQWNQSRRLRSGGSQVRILPGMLSYERSVSRQSVKVRSIHEAWNLTMSRWSKLGEKQLRDVITHAVNHHGSMRAAAASIPMSWATFRTYAKRFGVWKPNQGGKFLPGETSPTKISLEEILAGKHPTYSRGNLKRRLINAGLKRNECEVCGISTWLNKPLTLHIDHINGNTWDHRLENLRLLCPNCHSQTPTYCGRNSYASVAERQTHSV